ncbi:MAG: hypothetical protein QGH15_20095 [Kiritimatiellia bacterium]|jgi:hypothetical protein|nr:hypothetical protein [Kiritimatiellia bacterium]
MKAWIKDGVLHVELAVNNPPMRSASGKTLVVASSRGNKKTDAMVNDQNVVIGLNAYIK